jgi:hypothetical protein
VLNPLDGGLAYLTGSNIISVIFNILKVFTAVPGPDSSKPRPRRKTTDYLKRGMYASRNFQAFSLLPKGTPNGGRMQIDDQCLGPRDSF